MSPASRHRYDVVVVGGGPAGCATALSLALEGVGRVLVVESTGYERDRVGESVPPDVRRPLAQLGVLEAFLAEGHEPCPGSCASWGSDSLGYNDFLFNPHGHGWHLDRRRFDAFLSDEVRRRAIELRTHTRLLSASVVGEQPELVLAHVGGRQSTVRTRVAVDATGHRSLLARGLGARRRRLDHLTTATGYFELPVGETFPALTLLEAVEYGWWYAGRLPDRRIAVVAVTSRAQFGNLGLRHSRGWLAALATTRHLGPALARCRPATGRLAVRPATSSRLQRACGPWGGGLWLAAGDSASSYDPISSQGIFKALDHGVTAGRAIAAYLDGKQDAVAAYAEMVAKQFADYEIQRSYFYHLERRWQDAPFWVGRRDRKLEPAA